MEYTESTTTIKIDDYTLITLLCSGVSDPDQSTMNFERTKDRNRNPHNDNYKPPLRSNAEIIADYKIHVACMIMNRIDVNKLKKVR